MLFILIPVTVLVTTLAVGKLCLWFGYQQGLIAGRQDVARYLLS
jgi:hypothetical protein